MRFVLALPLLCGTVGAFQSPSPAVRTTTNHVGFRPRTPPPSRMTTHLGASDNDRDYFESQQQDALSTLEKIDDLEQQVREKAATTTPAATEMDDEYVSLYNGVQQLEGRVTCLTNELLPPEGLSLEEYRAALRLYVDLPYVTREALCQSLGLTDVDARQALMDAPEIVSKIYEKRFQLTPQRLQDSLAEAQKRRRQWVKIDNLGGDARGYILLGDGNDDKSIDVEREAEKVVADMFGGKSAEELQQENVVKQNLPRQVTGRDNVEREAATAKDAEVLMGVLDASIFVPKGKPEPIPGGFIVRGKNAKETGKELVEALDAKLPADWSAQVCFLPDFTREAMLMEVDEGVFSDPILVLTSSDLAPSANGWLLSSSTAAALISTFLFGVGCFAGNEEIVKRISEANAVGDYSGVSWFNNMLLELLVPLGVITAVHEVGHFLVASRDKFKITPPTLIPFLTVPFIGANTQLKTSPKDSKSLFDFAFLGPFAGIMASLIFLSVGLQDTVMADADSTQYYPAIAVELIKTSTLGGTIVDTFFGAEGIITTQDPSTMIKLHPYAVAGYIGLMVNCLDLLPLGSTDGGRLSQTIFGRGGHLIVGGATWTALLLSTLLLPQHDLLIGAWIVNNVVQNDLEIPARNEVDGVGIPRAVLGAALWAFAFFTLYPVTST